MSDLVIRREPNEPTPGVPALPVLPGAKVEINVRPGTLDDLPFIDALQKANNHALGFMYTAQLEGHIKKGNLLIAETPTHTPTPGSNASDGDGGGTASGGPVGYCIGADRYYKRDDLGIVYQMGVLPEYRRSLVAANLLRAQFEKSAYGCRLYCCWCAQDLAEANTFWEAMGFVPLAFRTGSPRRKVKATDGALPGMDAASGGGRIHIFWQKRIRIGDGERASSGGGGTPWWFPSETSGGAVGAARIVLPIPPGTHWSDAKPVVLPEELLLLPELEGGEAGEAAGTKAAETQRRREEGVGDGAAGQAEADGGVNGFAVGFGPPPEVVAQREADRAAAQAEVKQAKREKKQKLRARMKSNDPALCAFSRELRDRWQEAVAAQPGLIEGAAKPRYEVGRLVAGSLPAEGKRVVPNEAKRLAA